MGQKVNPISLRLQKTNRHFDSSWYNEYNYTSLFLQDLQIKNYLNSILKQIQYSQGRILVLNLPKKVLINFFYFNPKKFRAQNNQAFQIVRKNKKKFSFFTSPPFCPPVLTPPTYPPYGGVRGLGGDEGGQKSKISSGSPNKSLISVGNTSRSLPIRDLASSYLFSHDGKDRRREELELSFPLNREFVEQKNSSSSLSLPRPPVLTPPTYPPVGGVRGSGVKGRLGQPKDLKAGKNIMKFLLTSLNSNISITSLHNLCDGSEAVDRRNIEDSLSGLSTLYQSWIGKKYLYLFLYFLNFTVNKNKKTELLPALSQTSFPLWRKNKSEILSFFSQKDREKSSVLHCPPYHAKKAPPYPPTPLKGGKGGSGGEKGGLGVEIQDFNEAKKSLKFLNRYLLFLFYKQFLSNKKFNNSPAGLGAELLSGSSLSIPFEISDLWWKKKKTEKNFFPSPYPPFRGGRGAQEISPPALYKSPISSLPRPHPPLPPFRGVRGDGVGGNDFYKSTDSKEMMEKKTRVKVKDFKIKTVNNNNLSWRYKSHIEFTLLKNFSSSTNLRFFRSFTEKQSAFFLAQEIIFYLEQRIPFRRIKNQILRTIGKSKIIKGIRITCSGRVGGKSKKAQRAKVETLKLGQTSLHVFSSKIDFACKSALTNFGLVGVKVWICYF